MDIFGTGWARGSNPASLGGTHGDGQEGDQTKTLQPPHKIYVKIKVNLIDKIQNNDIKINETKQKLTSSTQDIYKNKC